MILLLWVMFWLCALESAALISFLAKNEYPRGKKRGDDAFNAVFNAGMALWIVWILASAHAR